MDWPGVVLGVLAVAVVALVIKTRPGALAPDPVPDPPELLAELEKRRAAGRKSWATRRERYGAKGRKPDANQMDFKLHDPLVVAEASFLRP